MINSFHNVYIDEELLMENVELTKIVLSLSEGSNTEGLSSIERKVQEVEKSSEGLMLKKLPKHLKYVFLE